MNRRKTLKAVSIFAASPLWGKPLVNAVVLPAHAQTSNISESSEESGVSSTSNVGNDRNGSSDSGNRVTGNPNALGTGDCPPENNDPNENGNGGNSADNRNDGNTTGNSNGGNSGDNRNDGDTCQDGSELLD